MTEIGYYNWRENTSMLCQVNQCNKTVKTKACGLCNAHYRRKLKYGDPLLTAFDFAKINRVLLADVIAWLVSWAIVLVIMSGTGNMGTCAQMYHFVNLTLLSVV